jgi:hypothetical protein
VPQDLCRSNQGAFDAFSLEVITCRVKCQVVYGKDFACIYKVDAEVKGGLSGLGLEPCGKLLPVKGSCRKVYPAAVPVCDVVCISTGLYILTAHPQSELIFGLRGHRYKLAEPSVGVCQITGFVRKLDAFAA